MKILSINTVAYRSNAPANIMCNISEYVQSNNGEAIICYGRGSYEESINSYRIGSTLTFLFHTFMSRISDSEGLHSTLPTKKLIKYILCQSPDIIHLHNIHGHYINICLLFKFLKDYNRPVVWTLHDCWAFTGHCSYYSAAKCYKWKNECESCQHKRVYPTSWFFDFSKRNFNLKKQYFTSLNNLYIVSVSDWLKTQINNSFFKGFPVNVIPNGINTDVFKPKTFNQSTQKIILGIASNWDKRKCIDDFIALSKIIPANYEIRLVGVRKNQQRKLPKQIKVIPLVSERETLAAIYSEADIYINTSREETFGMTTIEALSCGTPVIVNNNTALTEIVGSLSPNIAKVIDTSDSLQLLNNIIEILNYKTAEERSKICRAEVEERYSSEQMKRKYLELFHSIMQ